MKIKRKSVLFASPSTSRVFEYDRRERNNTLFDALLHPQIRLDMDGWVAVVRFNKSLEDLSVRVCQNNTGNVRCCVRIAARVLYLQA